MGHFEPGSEYFIYEADEFDRNFLSFNPRLAMIAGIDWDHHDIYPTRESYHEAFREFLGQSEQSVLWQDDAERLGLAAASNRLALSKTAMNADKKLTIPGLVNRQNAMLVANGIALLSGKTIDELLVYLDKFPGVSRRFEPIIPDLYTDYAHTPPKIRGALQLAREVAGDNVVVVYEGLHNTRQHFIKEELEHLFDDVKHLYIVPSYLAREDTRLAHLEAVDLIKLLSPAARAKAEPATLGKPLETAIRHHLAKRRLVLCLTAGGGGSLDEWLRQTFGTRY